MTNPEEKLVSRYTEVLIWASKQSLGTKGFTMEELAEALALAPEEAAWVEHVFVGNATEAGWFIMPTYVPSNRPASDKDCRYYLSAAGAAALVDYLELKEAQRSGRRAFWTSVAAIGIGVLVGLVQILVGFYQIAPDKTESFLKRTPHAAGQVFLRLQMHRF